MWNSWGLGARLGVVAGLLPGLVVVLLVVLVGGAAEGQSLSGAQQKLIDGRLSSQFQSTLEAAKEAETTRRRQVFEVPGGVGAGPFRPLARRAALKYNIPPALFEKLVTVESAWNPSAVSPKGAIGLAQLMPFTARQLGVNPRDPGQNLDGGARYLAAQYRRFGSWRLALAAYNAGPGAVQKYGGVPPFAETRNYVRKILGQ